MPEVRDMIQSKFLRKEDIDEDIVVSINDVTLEDMPGDSDEKRWVMQFRELPKGLVLNTTTIRVCEKAYGSSTDDWIGKKVTLFVDPNVAFKGQVVGGLRLRPRKAPTPKPQLVEEDLNDQIPA
jgi:hypothetical protein